MSRHLRTEDYSFSNLWLYVKADVRKNQSSGGVLILDDTISENPFTDENAINCWHFSHAKHRHVKDINLLSWLANNMI